MKGRVDRTCLVSLILGLQLFLCANVRASALAACANPDSPAADKQPAGAKVPVTAGWRLIFTV